MCRHKFSILTLIVLPFLELSLALSTAIQKDDKKWVDDILSSFESTEAMYNIIDRFTDQKEKSALLYWAHMKGNNRIFNRLLANGATLDMLNTGKVLLSMLSGRCFIVILKF